MTDLPDINVWFAQGMADHPHHGRATRYWNDEAAERIAFCRITALGLVRLSINSGPMGGKPLTVPDAWSAYQRIRGLPEVFLAPEPAPCEAALHDWIQQGLVTHRLWTDAYLAAFAVSAGMRLVSFDRDFARFPGLDMLHLELCARTGRVIVSACASRILTACRAACYALVAV